MRKNAVDVVMGSNSDWKVMRHAVQALKDFGVPHEARSDARRIKQVLSRKPALIRRRRGQAAKDAA